MKKKIIGELSFLKFIMALEIMFFHIALDNETNIDFLKNGGFGVEFFFVVSGYLMCCSAERASGPLNKLGSETASFILKKAKALVVPYLIGFFTNYGIWLDKSGWQVLENQGIRAFINENITFIPNFLLLSMSGNLKDRSLFGLSWYISAMLLAMLIIYPLLRRYGQNFRLIVAPIVAIFGTGYIYMVTGLYKDIYTRVGIFTAGMWRAILGICVGCMVYEFANYIKTLELSKVKQLLLSLCEVVLLLMSFYIFQYANQKDGFVVTIVFFFLLSIVCSRKHYFSGIFDNSVCYLLGEWSMYLYLLHKPVLNTIMAVNHSITLRNAFLLDVSISFILVIILRWFDLKFVNKKK